MKKILILIFTLLSFNSFAVEKNTTFNNEIFQKAQLDGKIVVINSWNETCTTKQLGIDYWTTIVIYQNNKEIYRSIGQMNKDKIYSVIKSL